MDTAKNIVVLVHLGSVSKERNSMPEMYYAYLKCDGINFRAILNNIRQLQHWIKCMYSMFSTKIVAPLKKSVSRKLFLIWT